MEPVEAVCVDTDVLVDYLRGREPGRSAFAERSRKAQVCATAITAFELHLGASLSSRSDERRLEVDSVLDQQRLLPLDRGGAEKAAELGAGLKRKGATIEIRDLLNAGICLSNQLAMLTGNRAHYEKVPGLRVLTP